MARLVSTESPSYGIILYIDYLRQKSNFFASTRLVTAFCVHLLQYMPVRLHNGYTPVYAQIMQRTHMHTHKAVTGDVEAKNVLSAKAIKP